MKTAGTTTAGPNTAGPTAARTSTAMNAERPTTPIALDAAGHPGACPRRPPTVVAHRRPVQPNRFRPSRVRPSRIRPGSVKLSSDQPSRFRPSRIGLNRVRLSRAARVIADLGSLVTLSALVLLGVAAAAGMIGVAPADEGPTYSVTFADR